eukprot:GFUD01012843.1.p1 GENE.GFUD01012843.1~~GFUD01012843.1.p1  ORF type:complete len:176 (+),score=20.99 GFUD01012843.1:27-530(+)
MQFLVVASALVAAVSAEAQFLGYPYAHGIVGLKSAPCVNAANAPVPCAAGYVAHHGYYGKRDADADPQLFYSAYHGVPFGSSTGLDPITQGLDASTQGVAPYAHYGYGHGYYGKRDAEADPQLLYGAYPYAAAYGAYPHAVAATIGGLVHSSHVGLCTNYLGAAVPC